MGFHRVGLTRVSQECHVLYQVFVVVKDWRRFRPCVRVERELFLRFSSVFDDPSYEDEIVESARENIYWSWTFLVVSIVLCACRTYVVGSV